MSDIRDTQISLFRKTSAGGKKQGRSKETLTAIIRSKASFKQTTKCLDKPVYDIHHAPAEDMTVPFEMASRHQPEDHEEADRDHNGQAETAR